MTLLHNAILASVASGALLVGPPAASSTPAPYQRSQVDQGFRMRLAGSVERIRSDLEGRLLALDLSDPANVSRFETAKPLLDAWNDLAEILPYLPDEEVERMRASLSQVRLLKTLQSSARTLAAHPSSGQAASGACQGYQGGFFAGSIGQLVAGMIDLIADAFDDRGRGETVPGISGLSDFISYPSGMEGERLCKAAQSTLEYLADLMPELSFSFGISIIIEGDIGIQVPSPLKIVFLTLALTNQRECIEAESANAAARDCEGDLLSSQLDGLQSQLTGLRSAMLDQLAGFEQNFGARADVLDAALEMVMSQNESMRLEGCEMIRLLHTPEGRRTSTEPNCAEFPGWPFDWNGGSR